MKPWRWSGWRPAGPGRGLLALALVLVASVCSKTATYTYLPVHVRIDMPSVPEDRRFQINSCVFQVMGAETAIRSLNCPPNQVQYDLGTFEWTTNVQTGTIQFLVQLLGPNQELIGEGRSDPITILPGLHLRTTELLVLGITTPVPDGGSGDARDGGVADAAGTADGSGDGPTAIDGATADGSSDGVPDLSAIDSANTDGATASDGAATDSASDSAGDASDDSSDATTEGPSDDTGGDGNNDATEAG